MPPTTARISHIGAGPIAATVHVSALTLPTHAAWFSLTMVIGRCDAAPICGRPWNRGVAQRVSRLGWWNFGGSKDRRGALAEVCHVFVGSFFVCLLACVLHKVERVRTAKSCFASPVRFVCPNIQYAIRRPEAYVADRERQYPPGGKQHTIPSSPAPIRRTKRNPGYRWHRTITVYQNFKTRLRT